VGEIIGNVILLGGALMPESFSTCDVQTLEELRNYHFHIAFISCTSFNWDSVANSQHSSSILVQRIMEQSNVSVLITDSDKIGKNSVYTFAKPTDFHRIIVDNQKPIPSDLLESIQNSETQLTVIPCEEGDRNGEE
jgi:DeoR/GlpR family transcriptional regulator of sugar metabolism